jgi:hypothetical protein
LGLEHYAKTFVHGQPGWYRKRNSASLYSEFMKLSAQQRGGVQLLALEVAALTTGLVLVGCLISARIPLKAQASRSDDNPRVGAWKLNVAKSTFNDGAPPRSELQICEALGSDTIRLKIVRVDASGKEIRSEYTAHYDGKDHPFPGSLWDTIALKRLDRNTSEAVFKKSGNTVQISTVSVSKDGQVLTLTARATAGVPGQPISHIEVFDRQ